MPKSKRSRVVALTKTDKRSTREHKSSYIEEVRTAVDNHDNLYLFSYENMRSNKFKEIRMHFRPSPMNDAPSRIFLGKNKLLQVALGRTSEDEYDDNLRQVSKLIAGGSVGLLFTSRPAADVEEFFANFVEEDFARAGFVSPKTVMVTNEMLEGFPVSMMDQFRKLGLPVKASTGKLILMDGRSEYCLCKESQTLSAEKCKLLVLFGKKLSEFRVHLVCRWSKGSFEMLE